MLEILPGEVALMFIGHIPTVSAEQGMNFLAAAGLSNMFMNITGVSVGLGILSAMDTLCSQTFGANEKKQLGIILQRGIYGNVKKKDAKKSCSMKWPLFSYFSI